MPRKRKVQCASIEGESLTKGWVCCACFRKHGAGVYNSPKRLQCKICGHDRCKNAMRRKWQVSTDEGLIRSVARGLAALSGPPVVAISEEWEKACSEVVSAFSAAEVHAEVAGLKSEATTSDVIAESVMQRLPRAMHLFNTMHVSEDAPCKCRHKSLIWILSQDEASLTGRPIGELIKSGQNVLDWYLQTVS